jgi:predicted transposase/invertase (TIGR01784 family)
MENIKNKTKKGAEMTDCKYLDPKADLTFKLVFGEHKDLAMSLLNALLPLGDDEQITSLEYATPEMIPENPAKKDSIVDVRCTDAKGRQFIVEMQMYWNKFFQKRVLLNASKAVVRQLDKREDYKLLQPVYCLNLVNDIGFESAPDEFYHDYAIVNVEHSDRIIEGLRFIFIELPKFQPKSIAEKKMAVLWLRFLTEISESTKEAAAELLENEDTRKALSIVEKSAMSEGQLYAYERFWSAVINEEALMQGSFEKGIEQGIQKGIQKGIEKERQKSLKEKLASAKALKKSGVAPDIIAQSLCLKEEEIAEL